MSHDFTLGLLRLAFPDMPHKVEMALRLSDELRDNEPYSKYESMFSTVQQTPVLTASGIFPANLIEEIMYCIVEADDMVAALNIDALVEFAKCSRGCMNMYKAIIDDVIMKVKYLKYRGLIVKWIGCESILNHPNMTITDNLFHYRDIDLDLSITICRSINSNDGSVITAQHGTIYLYFSKDLVKYAKYNNDSMYISDRIHGFTREFHPDTAPIFKYIHEHARKILQENR